MSGYLAVSQGGGAADGVPRITAMLCLCNISTERRSQAKSNLPSAGSMSAQANSAMRTLVKPTSAIMRASSPTKSPASGRDSSRRRAGAGSDSRIGCRSSSSCAHIGRRIPAALSSANAPPMNSRRFGDRTVDLSVLRFFGQTADAFPRAQIANLRRWSAYRLWPLSGTTKVVPFPKPRRAQLFTRLLFPRSVFFAVLLP